MKLLFQLCFLVLAISSVSQGQNVTTPPPLAMDSTVVHRDDLNASMTPLGHNRTEEETTSTSVPTTLAPVLLSSPLSPTVPPKGKEETSKRATDHPSSTSTASASSTPVAATTGSSSWGYIILVFILILIIALCVILFMLRRASRTYSFDLQRPVPSSNTFEPTGTFGQVYLDNLDQPTNKDVISDDLSTTPIPNGTSPQLEEKADGEENALQEPAKANDSQSSSSSSSSSSSLTGDDQAEKKSNQMSSNNLFFDAAEEPQLQQNENNNNPCVCSSSPFVEINLDEPAWSDQLLTSSQPTSSVLPFSPFSFSSSSGSS